MRNNFKYGGSTENVLKNEVFRAEVRTLLDSVHQTNADLAMEIMLEEVEIPTAVIDIEWDTYNEDKKMIEELYDNCISNVDQLKGMIDNSEKLDESTREIEDLKEEIETQKDVLDEAEEGIEEVTKRNDELERELFTVLKSNKANKEGSKK